MVLLEEREGFEPSVQALVPYNGLANRRFRPLSHLSRYCIQLSEEEEGFEPSMEIISP